MKRIAVFIAGWDSEVLLFQINGICERAKIDKVDVYVYNCFGGWDDNSSFNKGEYNIYNLPDISQFDGCIITSNLISNKKVRDRLYQKLIASKKPCVSVEHDLPDMDYIGSDNYTGMYGMIEHLIKDHNCRELCYVSGPMDNYESRKRYESFVNIHKEYSLPLKKENVYIGNFEFEDGLKAADFFMDNRTDIPDAFVCADDEMALGVIVQLKKKGICVPEDTKVVGFDNYLPGSQFSPRLTTVDRAKTELGYHCCDHLLKMMNGIPVASKELLPTQLVLSRSCGCDNYTEQNNDVFRSLHLEEAEKQKSYHQFMRLMEEDLISAKDINQYASILNRYLNQAGQKAFYIMLNSAILEYDYESELVSLTDGYDKTVIVAVAPENGVWKQGEIINAGCHLPTKEEDGRLIVLHPIHFQEKCLGYSVSIDDMFFLERDVQYSWFNIINNTLENCIRTMTLYKMNEILNKQYVTDPLTGLYNRFGYAKYANELFEKNKKRKYKTAIIFMDMDCLKKINDNYGHEQGDFAINVMGICVQENTPKDACAIRFGGDEFLMIATIFEEHVVTDIISNIENSLVEKSRQMLMPYELSASYGYVFTEESKNLELDDYVDNADRIMYINKQKKKLLTKLGY